MSRKRRPLGGDMAIVAQAVADLKNEFQYPDVARRGISTASPQVEGGGGAPTVVVAASDASQFSRDRADFRCDGTNDEVVIQAAIDAMGGPGLVWLTEGTFECTWRSGGVSVLDSNANGVSIRGLGNFATIVNVSGAPSAVDQPIVELGGIGCSVKDLYLFDNQAGSTSTLGVLIGNSYGIVENINAFTHGPAIDLPSGSYGALIIANIIDGTGSHAVRAIGTDYTIIQANVFAFPSGDGIRIGAGNTRLSVVGNTIISPNQHGINLEDTSLAEIADNIISEPGQQTPNTFDGVIVDGSAIRNYLHGNTIIPGSSARYGVNIATTDECNIVVGNDLGDPNDYGTDALNDNGANTQLFYPADATYGDNFTDCGTGS